jgi:hypothetical protein
MRYRVRRVGVYSEFWSYKCRNVRGQSVFKEATGPFASEEFPWILWNPNWHYLLHKRPSLAPFLSQINSSRRHTILFNLYPLLCHPIFVLLFQVLSFLQVYHIQPVCMLMHECAVGGVRHPQHTQTCSNSSTLAADSSNSVTSTRCCRYSCMRSWWWVEVPPETCRAVSRYK